MKRHIGRYPRRRPRNSLHADISISIFQLARYQPCIESNSPDDRGPELLINLPMSTTNVESPKTAMPMQEKHFSDDRESMTMRCADSYAACFSAAHAQ